MSLFYRPDDGVVGDVIPFYRDGAYHLFYLKYYRGFEEKFGEGTPGFHLVTRDFVHFEDWGEALPRGNALEQDLYVFTGSVIERDGVFHIFYTGCNPHFKGTEKPEQAILHATSVDLRTWRKDEDFYFDAPPEYEKDHWRDPFVLWDESAQRYRMLITARRPGAPAPRRGVLAQAVASDVQKWEMGADAWSPHSRYALECPDLFRIGEWWYLLFSDFYATEYRMSRNPDGPWHAPALPVFDGRNFYAAKTAGDETQRFLFGWAGTREGSTDEGGVQWGGSLVVHEIVQGHDGVLGVRLPATVAAAFHRVLPLQPQPRLGQWNISEDCYACHSPDEYSALTLGVLPESCLVEATLTFGSGTASCGLLLRFDDELENGYIVRFEPPHARLVLDALPYYGQSVFILERPLHLSPDLPVRVRVLLDASCLVIYVDDTAALTCRVENFKIGALGLFASEGQACFEEVSVKTRG